MPDIIKASPPSSKEKLKMALEGACSLRDDARLPEPPPEFQVRLDAVENAKLGSDQRRIVAHEMRVWQASSLGLVQMTEAELVEAMKGLPHTIFTNGESKCKDKEKKEVEFWHSFEYVYCHLDDALHERGMYTWIYQRVARDAPWYMPPILPRLQWTVVGGSIQRLKARIPTVVLESINDLKKLKLFNCFMAFADKPAWETRDFVGDILLVGRLSEMLAAADGDMPLYNGKQAFFPLARFGARTQGPEGDGQWEDI